MFLDSVRSLAQNCLKDSELSNKPRISTLITLACRDFPEQYGDLPRTLGSLFFGADGDEMTSVEDCFVDLAHRMVDSTDAFPEGVGHWELTRLLAEDIERLKDVEKPIDVYDHLIEKSYLFTLRSLRDNYAEDIVLLACLEFLNTCGHEITSAKLRELLKWEFSFDDVCTCQQRSERVEAIKHALVNLAKS